MPPRGCRCARDADVRPAASRMNGTVTWRSFRRDPWLLRQRRQHTGVPVVLLEKRLDLARRGVERLRGAHLADQRLVETQSENLLDLRAFGVTQLLSRELHRFEIRRHPSVLRIL